jgi:hypothetical protein
MPNQYELADFARRGREEELKKLEEMTGGVEEIVKGARPDIDEPQPDEKKDESHYDLKGDELSRELSSDACETMRLGLKAESLSGLLEDFCGNKNLQIEPQMTVTELRKALEPLIVNWEKIARPQKIAPEESEEHE